MSNNSKNELKIAVDMLHEGHHSDKMVMLEKIKELLPDIQIAYASAFLDGYLHAKEQ